MKPLTRLILATVEQKGIPLVLTLTNSSQKKSLGLVNVQKRFRKIIFKLLTAIKIKIFQQSSITTLRYNPIGGK